VIVQRKGVWFVALLNSHAKGIGVDGEEDMEEISKVADTKTIIGLDFAKLEERMLSLLFS
jgi:hypothetical protein